MRDEELFSEGENNTQTVSHYELAVCVFNYYISVEAIVSATGLAWLP